MSKFFYQGKTYEVPAVEYHDEIYTVIATGAAECISPRSCSAFLKNRDCREVMCADCIFSHYNHEARLEYLKMKGIVKMENNDTMPEIKGGMLVKIDGSWVLTANSSEGYEIIRTSDGAPSLFSSIRIYAYDKISEVYYDKGFNGAKSLCVSDIHNILSGIVDLTHPLYENIAVWRRPAPIKEMTMSDLEKHFGCKVKIVKEN